ncbi:MAG: acyltransferase [Planctomycetes bacterium]|nr:acyltransferase [Planctomycetota bacterium]
MSVANRSAVDAEPRIRSLDGVRGLAILLVIVFHSLRPEVFRASVAPGPIDSIYIAFASFGWFGVDLFFVLSGYLITGILRRSRDGEHYFRNFYARRALRIFPLYYAVIVLLLFVLPRPSSTGWEKVSYLTYWANLWLSVHPGSGHIDQARGITWSLAIEEQLYLIWPAVVFFASRRVLPWICIGLAIGAVVVRTAMLQAGADSWMVYVLTPCRLDALLLGALLSMWRPPQALARVMLVVTVGALVAIVRRDGHAMATGAGMQLYGYTCNVLLAASILLLATGDGVVARLFGTRALTVFGKYSYAMYLLHILVIEQLAPRLLSQDAIWQPGSWIVATGTYWPTIVVFTIVATAGTLAAAIGTWHLLEKHFLRQKRHFPSS